MVTTLRRAAALTAVALLAALPLASSPSGATDLQQRQLAVTTLSHFKVILIATRQAGTLNATVTAAGYRSTSQGWKLIAVKQIGKTGFWSWFATDVCNLNVAQLKPEPSSATPADKITVNLLWGPAIGCLGPYTKHWQP